MINLVAQRTGGAGWLIRAVVKRALRLAFQRRRFPRTRRRLTREPLGGIV